MQTGFLILFCNKLELKHFYFNNMKLINVGKKFEFHLCWDLPVFFLWFYKKLNGDEPPSQRPPLIHVEVVHPGDKLIAQQVKNSNKSRSKLKMN